MIHLTIWTNTLLTEQAEGVLAGATQPHRLIVAEQPPDDLAKASRNTRILEADVAFGQPYPEDLIASSRLRWVHISRWIFPVRHTRVARGTRCAEYPAYQKFRSFLRTVCPTRYGISARRGQATLSGIWPTAE
jgi:hypothetical protein